MFDDIYNFVDVNNEEEWVQNNALKIREVR